MQSNEPVLCVKCHRFYGNPATNGCCSTCHKAMLSQKLEGPSTTPPPVASSGSAASAPQTGIEESKKTQEPSRASQVLPAMIVQTDKTRCWKCNVRVGYLGFLCKCEYVYCSKHRFFDDHQCTYDYKKADKTKLAKDNPLVQAEKLDKL